MSEGALLRVGDISTLGKVEIAPEVLEVIASIAAEKVPGVASMRGNFASDVAERLGKKTHGKGIKLELSEKAVDIEVYIVITFGYTIPTIAKQLQEHVKQAIETMTGIRISQVNVHVVGVNTIPAAEGQKAEDTE
ncbi:Asp23/Gls24 family envelope stress response protein [Gracilibacillus alcaliphilus]|uniref:Asp23/Gls24 family envelope stress response protein n=1 Tax=Gracilibacillus alcaliphilus TaxID=1401441 RepID=UPI0019586BC5|nr:Asp23/Gls24 family envelope stress response protein [Gracilibacillus alcaliphilus]MBM7675065.1 putative alkaline shock family protein YloU [Gracilibacillus alcaliphilus]